MKAVQSALTWAFAFSLLSTPAFSTPNQLLKACLEERNSDRALDICAKAIEQTGPAQDIARILVRRCVALAENANYAAAKQACKEAINKDGSSAIAYYDLGNILMREQRYRDAILNYDKATSIDKNYAKAFNNKCYTYNYLKDYDVAVMECNKAISIDPNQPSFFVGRGNALLNKGDLHKAEADYLKARELDPNNQSALVGLAAVRQQAGDYAGAIKLLDRVNIDQTEDAATVLNNRCWTRALSTSDKAELSIALSDCTAALGILPTADWVLDSRALTYLKMGELEKAAEDYRQALILDPAKASSQYGYGLILQKKGDKRGEDYIRKAIEADRTISEDFVKYGVNSP
jgi:tetratricopeptide (TPR) repeat protein